MPRTAEVAAILGGRLTNRWRRGAFWFEVAGVVGVLGATAYALAVSWRKWHHPLIDFGRELYTPWRISEGAVLYRDVDDVYGPLSQHFNAALFKLFGPGATVLIAANLVVFAVILGLGYALFRRAWGAVGAVTACVVFVSVFGFTQHIGVGGFNYAAPYAHEATHGMLVSLALVAVLGRWVDSPTSGVSFGAGLLAGLALVLKPEFILAAAALIVTAGLLRRRAKQAIPLSALGLGVAGALLPTVGFAAYFARHFPPGQALAVAGRAWGSLFEHGDMLTKQYQLTFLGLDRPWANLLAHLWKTLLVLVTITALGGLVTLALQRPGAAARWALIAVATATALAIGLVAEWDDIGRSFLGLMLLWLAFTWLQRPRANDPGASSDARTRVWRILLGTLAVALMARMFLNGRIIQFGFVQSALAAMMLTAVLCAGCAEWMPAGRKRRVAVALVASALVAPALVWCTRLSASYYRLETFAVGEGRDRFFTFDPKIEPTGLLINAVVAALQKYPREATLLTLPEGDMVNYLARRVSPLPQFQFYSFTTEGGRERAVVEALAARPPDLIVVISRGLHDFGIAKYGERDGAGRQIIQWVEANYNVVQRFGDDPLDGNQRGACILERARPTGTKL